MILYNTFTLFKSDICVGKWHHTFFKIKILNWNYYSYFPSNNIYLSYNNKFLQYMCSTTNKTKWNLFPWNQRKIKVRPNTYAKTEKSKDLICKHKKSYIYWKYEKKYTLVRNIINPLSIIFLLHYCITKGKHRIFTKKNINAIER